MTKLAALLILALSFHTQANDPSLFQQGLALYENKQKDAAKALFITAASQGDPDAHFYLGYAYAVESTERAFHYEQAALKGHSKALEGFIEEVFLRASGLEQAQPKRALQVYKAAKALNPQLSFYNEESTIALLTFAAELPERDIEKFSKQYQLSPEKQGYYAWELAEQASTPNSIFGKPDPELILWLIIRGSSVPAEKAGAIREYYQHWKHNEVVEFNPCNYVTSGYGMGYCARRDAKLKEQQRAKELAALAELIPEQYHHLLTKAYQEAESYIQLKARLEELHGGTGRAAWITTSIQEQKTQFIQLIKQVLNGFSGSVATEFSKTDQQLNETYQALLKTLETKSTFIEIPTPKELRKVQRQWLRYRDATTELLNVLDTKQTHWLNWLTQQRLEQLKALDSQLKDY